MALNSESRAFEDVALPGLLVESASSPSARTQNCVPSVVAERFFRRVVKTDSCWIWTGAVSSPDGYGRMTFTLNDSPLTVSAHRLSLWIANGTLSSDSVAEHTCNEPLCVRPDSEHVHVSTQRDNLRFAVECGRASGPLKTVDSSHRHARSLAVRALAKDGFDADEYRRIIRRFSDTSVSVDQLRLF